jgi:hypothetical protein
VSYHRFIGGLHDGEWHDVRRPDGLFLPPIWTIQERPEVRFDPAVQTVEPTPSRRTDYKPLPLHHGKAEVVTFFIEYGMTPEEALLRLAACYKPTSGAKHE